jgi:hypothetical protein
MSELTKITVLGERRRVTLVIPADEPLGAHLAEIARLLEQPAARAALTTPYGEQLELALAPADQGVLDGAVVRLIDVEQLPAPPEVTDVTDRVAELRDAAATTWDARHALVGTALAIGVLSFGATTALAMLLGGGAALVVLVLTTLAATLAGLLTRSAAATLLLGAALGTVVPVALWLSGVLADVVAVGLLVLPALVVALAWLVLGVAAGVGQRSPAVALGASTGMLLTLAAGVPPIFGVDLVATAAVVATVAIVMLGLLPSLAVAASGLGSLDDEVIAGSLPGRDRVATSLADAFRVTAWSVVAIAIWLGPAIGALLASGELWPMLLGGAVALVTALRTRVVPMAVPSWALWIAAVGGSVVGVGLAPGIPTGVLLALCVAAAVGLVVLVVARPSVQTRIRLRRAGDLLESVGAVAIPPFLLGVFGVYAALLEVLA